MRSKLMGTAARGENTASPQLNQHVRFGNGSAGRTEVN